MRTSSVILAAGLLAALAACGTTDTIDPHGAYPDLGAGNVDVPDTGRLAVRTHPDVFWNPGGKNADPWLHSGYVVYDAQGKRVAEVRNRVFAGGEEDLTWMKLPAGRYLVRLEREPDDQPSTFWVTVAPNDLTLVDAHRLIERPGEDLPEPKVEPAELPVE